MKVVISRGIVDSAIEELKDLGYVVEVYDEREVISKERLIAMCQGADGLISMLNDPIDRDFLDRCPTLKVISNYAVGFNNIDVAYAHQRGVKIGNTPNAVTDSTADTAIALLLAASRRIVEANSELDRWITAEPKGYLGMGLKNKTVGIIGLGRIGTSVAKKLNLGWDMNVLYYQHHNNLEAEKLYGAKKVELDYLLKNSDFVSLNCPLTSETKEILNYESFKLMKPTAVIVNTARGKCINESDLIKALNEKLIFAAGLDVTYDEPINLSSPLLKMKNVVITPHIGSADVESRTLMGKMCVQNINGALTSSAMYSEV